MAEEIIYTMKGVGKVYPPSKYVLKNIYLSYFYGAKIGVLGLNGAGKSSLLRIMAGVDHDFLGEAFPARDFKVGYLEQEPHLNESKTVRENVMDGLGEITKLLSDFQKISEDLCDPDLDPNKMEKLIEKQGSIQEKIEALDGWEIDQKVEQAMEALRCPPGRCCRHSFVRGRKATNRPCSSPVVKSRYFTLG
jgi:sulfate-transporting ATPase